MEKYLEVQYEDITADAGYESEENYTYFEEKKQNCYIKPQNYERSKTKKFKNNMALRENMHYDFDNDEYTCQNGRKLRAVYQGKRKSKSGLKAKSHTMNVRAAKAARIRKTVPEAKGIEKCRYRKNS